MLSLQDEACKLEFRSERIPYRSVHDSFSFFFFPTIFPEEGLERYHSWDVSIRPFIKKLPFFRAEKNFWNGNVACNFWHVWPCLVSLNIIMLMLLTVMFPLSRYVEVLFLSLESFKLSSW